jgi:hypothetical protein
MTVDEQPDSGPGLWQRLRVPVIVAAVALAGLLYVAVNHRNEATSGTGAAATPSASGSRTPSTTASAAPHRPACLPRVLETGFSVSEGDVEYGAIVRSDCPQALFNIAVSARAFDTAGREIDGKETAWPEINVLLPRQQVGGAGVFAMRTAKPVGRVEVRFTDALSAPVSVFARWPASVRVADLTFSKPDRVGGVRATGRIVTEPASAALCWPHASLILRDSAGAIVGATWGAVLGGEPGQGLTHASSVEFRVPKVPAKADLRRATAYVTLGIDSLDIDFLTASYRPSGAACL